jgi:ABC-type transporter MlaC component
MNLMSLDPARCAPVPLFDPATGRRRRHASRRRAQLGRLLSIGAAALLIGAGLLPAGAHADSPEQFVIAFSRLLSTELRPTDLGEAERRARFAALLDGYVDLAAASALMLGSRWTDASAQDQAQFCTAFRDYLVRNFAARLHGAGERPLEITGSMPDGPSVIVRSVIRGTHADLIVEWRLTRDGTAPWRLSNVTVAGLSMAAVLRAQFDTVPTPSGTGLAPLVGLLRDQKRS